MNEARRCRANRKHGRGPCRRAAINGGTVCPKHGGSAPQVKRAAQERLADLIDPDRILREAAHLALADVRQLYDAKGNLKPITEWPDGIASAVGGFEVVRGNVDQGDGKFDVVVKPRLWDKPRALELLFKHLGLLKDKLEHSGGLTVRWKGEE